MTFDEVTQPQPGDEDFVYELEEDPREKGDDDGVEYGDPRDHKEELYDYDFREDW